MMSDEEHPLCIRNYIKRRNGNLMQYLEHLHPVTATLLSTLFTWGVTAAGAAVVFFFRTVNKKIMDLFLGFGAGVMIAASFWSLLAPAIELDTELGHVGWLIPAVGFAGGGAFVVLADRLMDRASQSRCSDLPKWKRSILLVSAITIHNIPEGMAVGVAFGGAALGVQGTSMTAAVLLALGIGLQNFPEGAAVSLPLRRDGCSRAKSFFYGQASGFVEPVAGLLGVLAALALRNVLPFFLSFAAGAMIAVVSGDLIPESANTNKNLAVVGVVIGFIVMMTLDVALG